MEKVGGIYGWRGESEGCDYCIIEETMVLVIQVRRWRERSGNNGAGRPSGKIRQRVAFSLGE